MIKAQKPPEKKSTTRNYNIWYEKYGKKPVDTIWERNKKVQSICPYSKKGVELQKASAKKYGRAWWLFSDVPIRSDRELTWIEQYRVKGH
tara:strand:+ start:169 stop:438 length:270 start_codon:yes stop_codon:yes gene_type:complete